MRTQLLRTLVTSTALGIVNCSEATPEPPPVTVGNGSEQASSSAPSSSAPSSNPGPSAANSAKPVSSNPVAAATGSSAVAPSSAVTQLASSSTAPQPAPALTGDAPTASTTTPPPALTGGPPVMTSEPAPALTPAPASSTTPEPTPTATEDTPTNTPGPFLPPSNSASPEPSDTAAPEPSYTADPNPTTPPAELDCDAEPPSGGESHASNNASGKSGNLDWTIWSNGTGGSIITYDVPAFSATWNNSGDLLARLGLQWDASKTYDQYGTITAQFAAKKTGSAGQYSYVGIYGWSVSPCVEFYIVDDSFNQMPVNPGMTTNKGTANIDGGTYTLYTRDTMGTGGSKCPGVNNWVQFYSVRQTARDCGQISVTEHFDAWAAQGMTLGKMDQAQLLIEVGGGVGSIDFTTADITTSE